MAALNSVNTTYPSLSAIGLQQILEILSAHSGHTYADLPTPPEPTFIFLLGSPGSGKSSAVAKLKELTGLASTDAIDISLDTIIESIGPYRAKTAKIGSNNSLINSEKIGASSKVYLNYMLSKKNINDPAMPKLPDSMFNLREKVTQQAIMDGKNIIFERTAGKPDKDTIIGPILEELAATKKPWKIFVIHTFAEPRTIASRLSNRPKSMMLKNPPFYRGVPPSKAEEFVETHKKFVDTFVLPRAAAGELTYIAFSTEPAAKTGGKRSRTRKRRT